MQTRCGKPTSHSNTFLFCLIPPPSGGEWQLSKHTAYSQGLLRATVDLRAQLQYVLTSTGCRKMSELAARLVEKGSQTVGSDA